ncbi:hypothetical protein ACNFBR_00845 [Pseudomonas sp. NY11955]|uniref:hypothetical protein n=1 Tax=Pseudomonas sp. NY11955 TaxID=3400363 RepID=UPI003A871667
MQTKYALWLNGNSLVWIDSAISDSRAEDLLNVQLAAYLTANKRYASSMQRADWHKEYLRIQVGFGCMLAAQRYSQSLTKEGRFEPWTLLRANLLGEVPSVLQPPLAECLNTFRACPDDTVQQVLWGECVRLPDSTGRSHAHIELRVILHDSTVISTELCFSTDVSLSPQWLWQSLEHTSVFSSQRFDGHYLTSDKQIDAIGAGLSRSIKSKQAQYRSAVRLCSDRGLEYV